MSKFKIKFIDRRQQWALSHDGFFVMDVDPSDLADLASATQAALAEQNSRVMGTSPCVCGFRGAASDPLCGRQYNKSAYHEGDYCGNHVEGHGVCFHRSACHSTQNTENQGE